MGLERVHSEDDIRINALRKWHGFLKQHVMQTLEQVRIFCILHYRVFHLKQDRKYFRTLDREMFYEIE